MPNMDGFELADKIREHTETSIIIFLTSHDEMASMGYKSKALRYVIKLNLERDIEEMLRLNIDMLCETDEESMLIVGKQVKNVQNGRSDLTKRWKNATFRWTSCFYAAMAERCFWVVLRADIRLCRIKRKRKTLHQLREEYMSLQEQQNAKIEE